MLYNSPTCLLNSNFFPGLMPQALGYKGGRVEEGVKKKGGEGGCIKAVGGWMPLGQQSA